MTDDLDYNKELSLNQDNEQNEDELFEHHRFTVDAKQGLLRIDKFLMDRISGLSRNKIQESIRAEHIFVNEQPVKANYKVKPGDVITVMHTAAPHDFVIIPEDIPLNVVYEDEQVLVINKPAGLVVHPGHGNWTGTLVNALAYRFQNLPTTHNGEDKPGLVHRIDKETSGLLIVAKTEWAMVDLANQFFHHTTERTYYALVWGEVAQDEGTINANIGRSFTDRRMRTVYPEGDIGKPAITHYKVLKRLRYVTLVQCNLETGRTHQIRVHMKHLGHPLFNDSMYGGNKILKGDKFSKYKEFVENCFDIMPRQALHAKSLGFSHPTTREFMQFNSELPDDFTQVLERWEKYVKFH